MTLSISNQYTILNDLDGKPLDSGCLYIGEAGKNPEVYPIPVFWDEDFTKPAHQPITTRNGFIYNNGGPSKLYANVGSCSIIVKNKKKVTVYTDLNVTATSASSIFDGDESQKDINDKSLAMCETVAQLRTLKPRKDGAVMFVKSHSNNGSGGVNYIWNEDSLLPDDDGYIIKSETTDTGRWIADYGTSPITPRHFGAKGDGENDERLQCEKSIVVAAKLKIKWLVQKEDVYLLNSYANYSEIASFSAGLLPLFSEQIYDIQGKLKVGSYFDDKDFFVFTDINAASPSNFKPVTNWQMYGGGTFDFSAAGTRKTTYKNRQGIYTVYSVGVSVGGMNFINGDLPNCITTSLLGKDFTIEGCSFINLMGTNIANDDHSTIYGTSAQTKVRNCFFQMSSTNAKLNACAVELHNSNSYFIDSIVKGYRASHIIAAITVETPYITDIRVSGLTCEIYRNFSILDVWTGATLVDAKIYSNSITVLPFPDAAELAAAGFTGNKQGGNAFVYVTNDSQEGHDLVQGQCFSVRYYDNTYINPVDPNHSSEYKSLLFVYKAMSLGIEFYNNTVSVPNIIRVEEGQKQYINRLRIDSLIIRDNVYDGTVLNKDAPIDLWCRNIQASVINIGLKTATIINTLANIYVESLEFSEGNTFKVNPEHSENIAKCFNVTEGLFNIPSNKLSYPATIGVYVNQVQVGVSDFYANNIKTAKIIGRGALPDTITVSDYVSNADTSKLTAIAFNSGSSFGTFNARLLLSNM
ncbi:hypothetical protein [Acinetobacter baumannii]|uniref:hypothetical protein n=1 Tax=Acinetobacter baumannii TaxID=470 RepID=UPI001FF0E4E0|nr:hypothetical protein [Acinetobacter baumannii]MCJ8918074.1 hypothetical protein [Acinetobacter baumannii]MCJ9284423.1 hypothetical protein [Acinetobacter baumannii]MCJ9317122.1 hypothetical protein [Acinetobacter baumannii]